ncbi:hypothetical protein EZI54_07430 [Marinobacter halodurans]|uniref:Uncharacterized protein n=1 Tax=Marinobacter halodurans TaxID=2528979 RepID=A0ABY1ZME7_9GAMM|nr:hypothetical protein [Marinobacter halodurans]TBW57483.1 hypothetical protein EZI54_07430 [Marinobacter halodurans]
MIMTDMALIERCNMAESPINWCWQFHAVLSPGTSLQTLCRHGERILPAENFQPPFAMPADHSPVREGFWSIVDINDSHDSDPFDPTNVSCDLIDGAHCTTYERYYDFLKGFRTIIESWELTNSQKRKALQDWFAEQEYPDVIYTLGGPENILDRYFPSYLLTLNDQGLSLKSLQALRLAGIDSPYALARISDSELANVNQFVANEWALLTSIRDQVRQAQTWTGEASVSDQLKDPYVQLIY